jgi:hypothetical protein
MPWSMTPRIMGRFPIAPSSAPAVAEPVTQVSTSLFARQHGTSVGPDFQARQDRNGPGREARPPLTQHRAPCKGCHAPAPIVPRPSRLPRPGRTGQAGTGSTFGQGANPRSRTGPKAGCRTGLDEPGPEPGAKPAPRREPETGGSTGGGKGTFAGREGPRQGGAGKPVVAKAETSSLRPKRPLRLQSNRPPPRTFRPSRPRSPPATVRTGSGTAHAKVPTPLKTRVTHAAAAAAPRKEHSLMTTANDFPKSSSPRSRTLPKRPRPL